VDDRSGRGPGGRCARVSKEFARHFPGKTPKVIVAPYFHVPRDGSDAWLGLNFSLWRVAALEAEGDETLCPILAVSRALLGRAETTRAIYSQAEELQLRRIALWVGGLDDVTASLSALANLKAFVRGASKTGLRVHALYGGYYTGLLSYSGLAGWCHRLNSDRSPPVKPSGRGTPIPKYYVPELHRQVSSEAVATAIQAAWPGSRGVLQLCSCPLCRRAAQHGFHRTYLQTTETGRPAPETAQNSQRYYLHSRLRELNMLRNRTLEDACRELAAGGPLFSEDLCWHIGIWLQALRSG